MKRLGIFGGTFDPIHVGHLILASEACDQLNLDLVLWVLTPDPPHKRGQKISPLAIRKELLETVLSDDPHFSLSEVDIQRDPPHYAVDTVNILHTKFPEAELFYLMGGDSLEDLPNWYHPEDFLKACDGIAVMHRLGSDTDLSELEAILPGVTEKTYLVNAPMLQISASDVRYRIRTGKPFRYFVPGDVYRLINQRHWYQDEENSQSQ